MHAVILVVHLIVALALIGLIMIQRSEGGGLGIGGGGGGLGGVATPMGMGNALTRATAICAVIFFATNLTLAIMAGGGKSSQNILGEYDKVIPAVAVDSPDEGELTVPVAAGEGAEGGEKQEGVPSVPVSE